LNWEVDITIEEPFEKQVSEEWLKLVIDSVMLVEPVGHPVELSLLITGDETVRELNRIYRQIDSTTDVLAFAMQEGEDFPSAPEEVIQLGEVIISFPQAERQANQTDFSIKQEVTILTIHGMLHLLGYNHESDEDAHIMEAKENVVFQNVFQPPIDHKPT